MKAASRKSSRSPVSKETPAPEALLTAIVDSSDDAIVSKTLDSVVTSWNRSAERIFGYSAAEMIGRSITIIIPPDRGGEEEEIIRKVRAGERIDHFETVRQRKDGSLIDVAVSISPVYSARGKVVGASKVARDMSETNRVARTDQLLAAIVNSSDDAIISKNLDGIITSWNAGAQHMFGYAAEEIVGQSVLKLIPEERKSEEPKILRRLRRGERMEHFDTVRLRKDGERIDVSLTVSPVKNAAGKIVGASKIVRDISEAKKAAAEREMLLESERSARWQAEHANRMKDEFLATVSHELRTPLNAIVGWTDVLEEGGQNRAEVIHGVDVIKKNALMQAQLIEDLLDLGRITSGKMALEVEPVDVPAIVREAIASVQHAADAKQVVLRAKLGAIGEGVMGDPKRLQQVVSNLLTNGIKFTENGGRVTVTARRLRGAVEIAVADNGCGIDPQFLPHVFERFRQADASTTRKTGGLGIGLALVKQLVELHGGTVTARSRGVGQGAAFTVTLPLAGVQAPTSRRSAMPSGTKRAMRSDLAGLRVMAVDDDRDSLDVVKRILTGHQADVRTATSVEEAMEVLRTFSPDVVLSDIGMPKQDGYEFVRQLRRNPLFAGVPAVALTALAREGDRTSALEAGFQTHIAKPVEGAELVAVVRRFGRLRSARDNRRLAEITRSKAK